MGPRWVGFWGLVEFCGVFPGFSENCLCSPIRSHTQVGGGKIGSIWDVGDFGGVPNPSKKKLVPGDSVPKT